jgi:hypothetical protein
LVFGDCSAVDEVGGDGVIKNVRSVYVVDVVYRTAYSLGSGRGGTYAKEV